MFPRYRMISPPIIADTLSRHNLRQANSFATGLIPESRLVESYQINLRISSRSMTTSSQISSNECLRLFRALRSQLASVLANGTLASVLASYRRSLDSVPASDHPRDTSPAQAKKDRRQAAPTLRHSIQVKQQKHKVNKKSQKEGQ